MEWSVSITTAYSDGNSNTEQTEQWSQAFQYKPVPTWYIRKSFSEGTVLLGTLVNQRAGMTRISRQVGGGYGDPVGDPIQTGSVPDPHQKTVSSHTSILLVGVVGQPGDDCGPPPVLTWQARGGGGLSATGHRSFATDVDILAVAEGKVRATGDIGYERAGQVSVSNEDFSDIGLTVGPCGNIGPVEICGPGWFVLSPVTKGGRYMDLRDDDSGMSSPGGGVNFRSIATVAVGTSGGTATGQSEVHASALAYHRMTATGVRGDATITVVLTPRQMTVTVGNSVATVNGELVTSSRTFVPQPPAAGGTGPLPWLPK